MSLVVASLINIPANLGYPLVFVLVAIETMGIPVPGETALVTGALAASTGQLQIGIVIALAATAAILGDNVGFVIGRKFGRRIFERSGPLYEQRLALLDIGQPFFERHGPKAVFLGRWVSGLRIASSWLAGMNKMNWWPTFLFWNALGGILWATGVGLGAYFAGHTFEKVISKVGIFGAAAIGLLLIAFLAWRHRKHAGVLKERGREIRLRREAEASTD